MQVIWTWFGRKEGCGWSWEVQMIQKAFFWKKTKSAGGSGKNQSHQLSRCELILRNCFSRSVNQTMFPNQLSTLHDNQIGTWRLHSIIKWFWKRQNYFIPSQYVPVRWVLLCCFMFKSVKATSCFWQKVLISKLIVRNVMGWRLDSSFQRDRNINYLWNHNNAKTCVMVTPE